MEGAQAAAPVVLKVSMSVRRFDSAGSVGDVPDGERAFTAESYAGAGGMGFDENASFDENAERGDLLGALEIGAQHGSAPPSPVRESSRGFDQRVTATPESPGFGAMRRGYFSEEGDDEVDEMLDYNDEAMCSPMGVMRYPMSPLRSPPDGSGGGGPDGEGEGDPLYASQTLSEVSEIEEDLDEGGYEDVEYHQTSGLGKPVAIRPMRLSPDFFTGFGRAAHRGGAHSRGSNGGLDSPATPGMSDDRPQCVLPGLFIGALEAARNINALTVAGITHVLTLGMGMDLPEVEKRLESHRVIAVEDKASEQTSLAAHLNECMDYIHDCRASGGKVLVHCLAGRSRSASIVAAYLMVHNKCGVDEALAQLRLVRPWIAPNEGFLNMLRAFQDDPTFKMPEPESAPDSDVRGSSSDSGMDRGRGSRSGSPGSRASSASNSREEHSPSPPALVSAFGIGAADDAAGGGADTTVAAPLVLVTSGHISSSTNASSSSPPTLQGSDAERDDAGVAVGAVVPGDVLGED